MEISEAKIIADGIVSGMVASSRETANAIIKSSRETANAIIKSSENLSREMSRSSEKSIRAIQDNSENNSHNLVKGFQCVANSMGGTKAELMLKCLSEKSNGGPLPAYNSKCKEYAQNLIAEFDTC